MESVRTQALWQGGAIAYACLTLIAPSLSAAQQERIAVGPNVQVSKVHEQNAHGEVLIAADAKDPSRLLGCSTMFSDEQNKQLNVVYMSSDGGKSWTPTLETDFVNSFDPACAFGPAGAAYTAALVESAVPPRWQLAIYRSIDYGKTWRQPSVLPRLGGVGLVDREYIAVDQTGGKYDGRIYVNGAGSIHGLEEEGWLSTISLLRSRDSGASFEAASGRYAAPQSHIFPGNCVVLSDGLLVCLFNELRLFSIQGQVRGIVESERNRPNGSLKVVTSEDGGSSLTPPTTVSDVYLNHLPTNSTLPYLAADAGNTPFKDRLYAVWSDRRTGRNEILLSYSADKGKTWSKPALVNDDRPFPDSNQGPDDFMPVVAVTRDGVLGISWYDRRENPENLGWWVRFTASLDGGETFLPSVRVSGAPNAYGDKDKWVVLALVSGEPLPDSQATGHPYSVDFVVPGFHFNGGDTAGMVADAAGKFHPFWVDNRTGVPQVWTATVAVRGKVTKNGSADLAELEDISQNVTLDLSRVSYDRTGGLVSVSARLKNMSKEVLVGPFKLRALSLGSQVAKVEVVGADNREAQAGAVWDFSNLIKGNRLKPGESSESKKLAFRVSDVRPLRTDFRHPLRWGLVSLQVRILGKFSPER